MVGRVHAIHQNPRLAISNNAGKRRLLQRSGNEFVFVWRNISSQEIPGDRPIKSTRVDISKTKPAGELSRNPAFSGGSRTINGNHTTRAPIGSMRSHGYFGLAESASLPPRVRGRASR